MTTYIIVGLIILVILFLLFIEPIIAREKVKNKNEHGSARWSTFNEIKKHFKKECVNSIKEVGFPIWYSKDNKQVWFDKQTPHWIYLGSTGSGKSVTAVIPMCSFIANANKKRSVFITDPKAEIFESTSKMFSDNGYEIITIDFRNPQYSNKINLLESVIIEYESYINFEAKVILLENDINTLNEEIRNTNDELNNLINSKQRKTKKYKSAISELENKIKSLEENINTLKNEQLQCNNDSMSHYAEANRLITSISTMIMADKESKDPFWNNSAKNLLEGLIGLFLEDYKDRKIERHQITLSSIKKFQNSSMTDSNFKKFKSYIESKPYGVKSKDSLISILSTSENTYKSITSVFNERMSLFDDINVENITATSDFEFDILGKQKTVIYFIVPDEDKIYFTLITIIIGLLYRKLVRLANIQENKKLPVEIDWLLDEFANCPPLADIETIVSVARSRGMRFQFFIQSFAQLDNVYGKEVSQVIQDNCGLAYLKTNTDSTAEAISKRLGTKTIESSSVSHSISLLNNNGNKTSSLMGRALLTPDEIKQLHYKTIIFPIVGHPVFRDTIMYNKFSCYSKGCIDRKINYIQNLNNTYYTVEHIDFKVGLDSKPKKVDPKKDTKVDNQKGQLDIFIKKITNELVNYEYRLEYYEDIKGNIFAVIEGSVPLGQEKISKLEPLSTDDKYDVIINIGSLGTNESLTRIEIKLKNTN